MSQSNQILFYIIEYLHSLKAGANADGIDTITSLLEAEFSLPYDAENFKAYGTYPVGLKEVIDAGKSALNVKPFAEAEASALSNPRFQSFLDTVTAKGYFSGTAEGSIEYLQRYAKLVNKFHEKAASAPTKEDLEKSAEDAKLKGNAAISAKDYSAAEAHYSEAIKLSPEGANSHVYFCNRAAACCFLSRYEDAVNDCLSSIALSPDYVKAFSRLGLAYYHQEKYQEALEAYERAAELEPDNSATKDSLRQVKLKLKKTAKPSAGAPGTADMMNNPTMKKALDQVGGTSGLANLMKDPQMMAMAQQMMKDPAMMQQAMSMLGSGGGGMPDMSALAGLMGGMGGMPPMPGGGGAPIAGGEVPSSSSAAKGGKKPFKGFEE